MTTKQAAQVVLGLFAVLLGAILIDILLMALGRSVPHLVSPLDDVVVVLVLIVHLVLTVVLFFAIPQTLILWWASIDSRWPYFLVGVLSAAMFMTLGAIVVRLDVAVAHTPSVWSAFVACIATLANVRVLTGDFAVIGRDADLYWLMAIDAAICGFGWRNLMYRLPGDTGRDWEGRVLGGRPPYSR